MRRRCQTRMAVVGLLISAVSLAACGSSKPRAGTTATTTTATSSPTTSSTTTASDIGHQAFAAYQQASILLYKIEGSPTGSGSDSRLATSFVNPGYSEVQAQINALREKGFVLSGPYSFANFQLDQVTPDGRVIFTVCETSDQGLFDASTRLPVTYTSSLGGLVVTPGTSIIPEQVVVYHPSATTWQVADDNTNTAGSAHACAR